MNGNNIKKAVSRDSEKNCKLFLTKISMSSQKTVEKTPEG